MADPIVHITAGIPDSGTGNITTLGQTLIDGANLALGATTDAAATGAGTVNAHLRSIATNISTGISVSEATTSQLSIATGTIADAAWTGTGTATIVAALKGVYTSLNGSLPAGANVIGAVTQSGTWTIQQGTPPWSANGDTASGATDANNPVKIGGVARTVNPTAVTTGQRVNATFDKLGKQIVVGAIRDLKGVQKTSISVGTETTVVTAGAAGVFNDVYAIVVTNKSATGVFVDFKDATAGTTRMTIAAPASDTRGFTVAVDSAMPQAVAANNWTATVSSAVSSIEITMLFVSNT